MNMHLATLYNPQLLAPFQGISASQYINRIIPVLIYIGFVVCILAFVILLFIGGIQYITSGGDKAKLEGGRNRVTNAITGLIILLLLWFILKLFNLLFGIDIGGLGPWTPGPPGPTSPPIATPTIGVPTTTPISCGGRFGVCVELNYCLSSGGSCIAGSCPPMVNPCCCVLSDLPSPTPSPAVGCFWCYNGSIYWQCCGSGVGCGLNPGECPTIY